MSIKERQKKEKTMHQLETERISISEREVQLKREAETQKQLLERRADDLKKQVATAKEELKAERSQLKAERLQLQNNSAENERVLARARAEAKAEIDRQKLKVQVEQKAREKERLQHEEASRSTREQLRLASAALEGVKQKIENAQRRKLHDRADYTRYRYIFDELMEAIFIVFYELRDAQDRIIKERDLWARSARNFRTSENLRLFLHSSKYEGVKNAIGEYLAEQDHAATAMINGLDQIKAQFIQERKVLRTASHESRTLTRHHQMDDHQSAYEAAHLAHYFAARVPIHDLQKIYHDEVTELESKMQELPKDDPLIRDLSHEIREVKAERRKADQVDNYFKNLQELAAFKALEDDDIVEKAVWVNTFEARQRLQAVVERYHTWSDEINTGGHHKAAMTEYRGDLQALRMAFDALVAHERQRYLLAQDLGTMEESEQKAIEGHITRRVERARHVAVLGLAGLGLQTSRRTRRSLFAISTASLPMPKDAVGDVKHGKISTASLTEKKGPVVARGRVGRVRKRSPMASGGRASSSKRTRLPPKSGSEVKVRRYVSGAPIPSALKATESRQARYRRPSYDTGEERGENMGFRTLRDALARGRSAEGASEDSTAQAEQSHGMGMGMGSSDSENNSPQTSSSQRSIDEQPSLSEDAASEFTMSAEDESSASETSSSLEVKHTPSPEVEETPSFPKPSEAAAETPTSEEPPLPTLTYQIPAKDYRSAVMASPSSNAAWWSHTLYKSPSNQKPTVYYCQNYEQTEAKAKLFLDEPVLGFDLEWESGAKIKPDNPDIKRNISLIQIACEDKIGLFQLARFRTAKTPEEYMPPSLRKILESADIVKAGVNVRGDAARLKTCLGVEMKGLFELSHLYRVVKQSEAVPVSFKLVSLAAQVQEVLLLPLKKGDVRTSSWSKELNTQQTSYAAGDAYAGFQLFHKLDSARRGMVPRPPRPEFSETKKPLVLGSGQRVYRSDDPRAVKKTTVKKTGAAGAVVEVEVEEDEEGEEFFDALEGIDPYELGDGSSAPLSAKESTAEEENSGSTANASASSGSAAPAKQEIAYPILPSQTSSCLPENAADSTATPTTSAPSKTTILPLRAKLVPKPPPPSSPEKEKDPSQSKQPRPQPLPCPENQLAETWIAGFRTNNPSIGVYTLRSYHLWHHQRFEPEEVAGYCRDPPLAITTVASYIMEALKVGGLPFDEKRVEGVLSLLPPSVHGKYRGVLERGGKEK
jgi:hypothetical protein